VGVLERGVFAGASFGSRLLLDATACALVGLVAFTSPPSSTCDPRPTAALGAALDAPRRPQRPHLSAHDVPTRLHRARAARADLPAPLRVRGVRVHLRRMRACI
jgi:hypothetical protein